MWGRVVQEVRRAGPKKVAIIAIVAALAVVFAYGDNSTNDAASGKTLPRVVLGAAPHGR
jgi:hypothetical protein